MQSLLARHGKSVIKGGALQGKTFEEIPKDRVLKSAKRYTGDPEFSKYARAFALLSELQDGDIPEPCLPLVPVGSQKDAQGSHGANSCFRKFLNLVRRTFSWPRYWKLLLLMLFSALICRPSFSRMASKVIVTTFRVSLRRLLSFCISILEGMLDELIYQMDFMMRDALPSGVNIPEAATASFNLISHLISSGMGAALALLVQARRVQVQA